MKICSACFILLGALLRAAGTAGQAPNATAPRSGEPVYTPAPGSDRPARADEIPLYREFYDEPRLYRRAHVLLEGIERKADINTWWRINSPEAYVVARTVGPDTGSTDYFTVGSYEFKTRDANNNDNELVFSWDKKALLIFKVGGTDAIELTVFDRDTFGGDDILMDVTIPLADLPQPGDEYVDFRRTSDTEYGYSDVLVGAELLFKIKVTEGTDRVTWEDDLIDSMKDINGRIDYGENVLDLSGGDKALLQSWRHVGGQKVDGAVLWVIGRNDCYMHPHVLKHLFFVHNMAENDGGPRFDVYVLNWRENGLARQRGWVMDAWLTTHNKYGDFDVYLEEIGMSLDLMKKLGDYSQTVGYAHSTGVPLLLNWVIKNGDDDFDSFLFNGPFLDWGHVGGDLNEFALEQLTPFLTDINFWSNDRIINSKDTPEAYEDDPIIYLGREVVPSAFGGRYYSQYYVDWPRRPLYSTSMTAGFARGTSNLFDTLEDNAPITSKPTLVLASLSDDILDPEEMEVLSFRLISNQRQFIGLPYGSHDVFLSGDKEDTMDAIAVAREWLKGGFYIGDFGALPATVELENTVSRKSSASSSHLSRCSWVAGFTFSTLIFAISIWA